MEYKHKNPWFLREMTRKDATEYIHQYFNHKGKHFRFLKVVTDAIADELQYEINDPRNTRYKSIGALQTGIPYWNKQKMGYVRSNLRGYIFYFICNECGRRVKYLYEHDLTQAPLCRICCRLDYKRKRRSEYSKPG